MRVARTFGLCSLVVLGLLACVKKQKDNSRVIASVGGEKITENYFNDTMCTYLGDADKANDLLTKPDMREKRNQVLQSLVNQKALFQFVKLRGLDKDPQVQLQIATATADAYFQLLLDRLVAEPTEHQLRALYNDYVTQTKAANKALGMPTPTFEQIKTNLSMVWKREQGKTTSDTLLAQINQQFPVVIEPEYQLNQRQP